MESNRTKATLQEREYAFPYHHLVDLKPFSQAKTLFWGYEYASYLTTLLDKLASLAFDSLVDVGCGDGRFLKAAAVRFPNKDLHGFDISVQAITLASCLVPGVSFSTHPTKADLFTCIEVLEHIPPDEIPSFVRNLPADRGIITVPSTAVPVIPKHHQHFDEASLAAALSPYFRVVSMERLNAKGIGPAFIRRLLSNRFFELRAGSDALFRFYHHFYGKGSVNGKRLLAVVERAC